MKILSLCYLLPFFIVVGITQSVLAQGATETLDANNAKITLRSNGIWGYSPEGSGYQWPNTGNNQGPGPGLLFSGNLWIGGLNDGGNLKLSAETYGLNAQSLFRPGPLNEEGTISLEDSQNWDRLFKVNRTEIENFQADYNDNGVIDDTIPNSILGWPGLGNPSFSLVHGFALPNIGTGLADYFDRNGNEVYEPMKGDYPLINCADQAVWWVFNDSRINSNSSHVTIEIQVLAYVYDSNLSNLNNTSFYDVKTIYKGFEPLDSTYFGIWIDPDLGCPFDDYIGCIPEAELGYIYNSDAVDGLDDGTCNGIATYEEAPVLGIKLLKGPWDEFGNDVGLSSFTYYLNGGSTPTPPANISDPNTVAEYYNYLAGRKRDGSYYLNSENEPTNFTYSGNPVEMSSWSMCNEEIEPVDTRLLMSMGPVRMMPGATNLMSFALVVQPQPELPCPDISDLITAADFPRPSNVSSFFCNLMVNAHQEKVIDTNFSVFPNPAVNQINFQLSETESIVSIRLYGMNGQLVRKLENIRSSNMTLPRNDLPSGTYIYQVQTEKGASLSGKIILE